MSITRALGALLVLISLTSSAFAQGVGYEDTPVIPGTKWRVHDKARPNPKVIEPGPFAALQRPADAIVLFDGTDLKAWTGRKNKASWKIENGYMEVNGTGEIATREHFEDCQLHLEFATPSEVKGSSQGRGNSGLFLMGRYEIQILDSYKNRSYADGQAAALYGQHPPLANACRAPGEWQTYDISFRAPRFAEDGKLISAARVTVIHNGIVVQNGQDFMGPTRHRTTTSYKKHGTGPIKLQDHGNPIRFRNIWVRKL